MVLRALFNSLKFLRIVEDNVRGLRVEKDPPAFSSLPFSSRYLLLSPRVAFIWHFYEGDRQLRVFCPYQEVGPGVFRDMCGESRSLLRFRSWVRIDHCI